VTSSKISFDDGELNVPATPRIPFIAGDGIGPEVMAAALEVLDAAVTGAYGGSRSIDWFEVAAGQSALARGLDLLPRETVDAIAEHRVAIKGPTMTPVGGGHRSINVTLRQTLDLYACVRPVRYFDGVTAPVTDPAALDVVIFRENTEDVYAGIEYAAGSDGARRIESMLADEGHALKPETGIGVKIISRGGTRRLVRAALEHALANGRRRVTLVHKGNIMKTTEGAFRAWGFDLVREEYAGRAVVAADLEAGAKELEGLVIVDDRIADAMFQELLLRPALFEVIAAPNLNGDYLSDACAAQVGGLGIAPGANIGQGIAVFEATHGTAPDIAGKGIANPGSAILSGAMLLEFIGWGEAARSAVDAFARVLRSGRMTVDLAAGRQGVEVLGTTAFKDAVIGSLEA
jgi:isocitrate dehydrogenase